MLVKPVSATHNITAHLAAISGLLALSSIPNISRPLSNRKWKVGRPTTVACQGHRSTLAMSGRDCVTR